MDSVNNLTSNPGLGSNAENSEAPRPDQQNNQVSALLELLRMAQQLPAMAPRPMQQLPTPTFVDVHREQRVNWTNMPKLDLSTGAEIDNWFISFEARMAAAHAVEENWASRFIECPFVDESIKAKARSIEPMTYRMIRAVLLGEHGPVDPVNFYRRELYKVRGTSREEVREKLVMIQTIHNRAAEDEAKQKLVDRDLCYPFINSFPVEIREELEQKLALVFAQKEPFEQLFRLAPTRVKSTSEELNIMADTPEKKRPQETTGVTDKLREEMGMVLKEILDQRPSKRFKNNNGNNNNRANGSNGNRGNNPNFQKIGSRQQQQQNRNRRCFRCGSQQCMNNAQCPARNVTCYNCNRIGHYSKACKGPFRNAPAPQTQD